MRLPCCRERQAHDGVPLDKLCDLLSLEREHPRNKPCTGLVKYGPLRQLADIKVQSTERSLRALIPAVWQAGSSFRKLPVAQARSASLGVPRQATASHPCALQASLATPPVSHSKRLASFLQYSSASHPIHNTFGASSELSEDTVHDALNGARRVDINAGGKVFPGIMVAEYQHALCRLEARLIWPPI